MIAGEGAAEGLGFLGQLHGHQSRRGVQVGIISLIITQLMATPVTTPKHTDPATKRDEKKNETEVKDKVSGKTKVTQKK